MNTTNTKLMIKREKIARLVVLILLSVFVSFDIFNVSSVHAQVAAIVPIVETVASDLAASDAASSSSAVTTSDSANTLSSSSDTATDSNGNTVTVESGPQFEDGDADQIKSCVSQKFQSVFPLDLFQTPINPAQLTCPELDLFGNSLELCQIVDAWQAIRPILLIGLTWQAVINL